VEQSCALIFRSEEEEVIDITLRARNQQPSPKFIIIRECISFRVEFTQVTGVKN